MQLALRVAFEVEPLASMIQHVERIVNYVRIRKRLVNQLIGRGGVNLIASNDTRWNSTYLMLLRYRQCHSDIKAILTDGDNDDEFSPSVLVEDELDQLEVLLR